MKFPRHPLYLALGLAVLCHSAAVLADNSATPTPAAATNAPADAAASNAPDAASPASELDTISVVAEGSTRQVQTVGREEIKKAALGTSPLKVLDKLPGVYFESADAWGTYEWSQRITFRGFNRQQLGYTLDDIPLGNGAYSTDNGLSVNRAILAENIRSIEIAQGGGALGMPSSNNLGGTIAVHTDDPNKDAGVRVSQGFGSDSAWRSFIRADTGEINGFSAYLSGASTDSQKWRGDGSQDQSMLNAKVVYAWGGNKISAFVDVANRDETDYQDLSLNLIQRDGYRWDNFQPNWAAAVQAANYYGPNHTGTAPAGTTTIDDAYYSARGIRHDDLYGLEGQFALTDNIALRTTLYNHEDKGQGHWFTPYVGSPDGTPISLRVSDYRLERNGAVAALDFDLGAHAIEAGFWYEQANNNDSRGYVAISGPIDDRHFFTDFFYTQFQQRFSTETKQAYIQDTWTLLNDSLKINYGFKAQNITTDGVSVIGTRGAGTLKADDNFLPQVGVSYKLTDHEDVFANYNKNQSAFTPGLAGPWSASAASFTAAAPTLKPEQSTSFEAGVRTTHDTYQASATVYNAEFSNRLLLISPCPGIQSCPTQFANVGKVRNQGVELAFLWKPLDSLSWLNSFAYNKSNYQSNYVDASARDSLGNPFPGNVVPLKGKDVVDAPKKLFSSSLDYRFLDGFSANLSAKFTDKRYYTYLNDQTIPSYWIFDAGISYERTDLSWTKDMRISLGVSNIGNKNYIATVGTNGFAVNDPSGTFATLLSGAPRQYFGSIDLRW